MSVHRTAKHLIVGGVPGLQVPSHRLRFLTSSLFSVSLNFIPSSPLSSLLPPHGPLTYPHLPIPLKPNQESRDFVYSAIRLWGDTLSRRRIIRVLNAKDTSDVSNSAVTKLKVSREKHKLCIAVSIKLFTCIGIWWQCNGVFIVSCSMWIVPHGHHRLHQYTRRTWRYFQNWIVGSQTRSSPSTTVGSLAVGCRMLLS